MAITLAVAVGSVLLVICGFTWAARRDETERVAQLERLTPTPLANLVVGELGAARGTVADGPEAMDDPVTGERVVYYEVRVLRPDRGEVLAHRAVGERLRLEDGSGVSATVELVGAEFGGGWSEAAVAQGSPSDVMVELLSEAGVPAPPPSAEARYVVEHRAIPVGAELTLVGVPARDGRGLHFTSAGPLYLVEDDLTSFVARQRADLRAMDRLLAWGAAIGALLVLGGVALVWALG